MVSFILPVQKSTHGGMMSFIVMSGPLFGSFTFVAPNDKDSRVRDVTWQAGRLGLEAVTRFATKEQADAAASQVYGQDNHAPEIFEVTD